MYVVFVTRVQGGAAVTPAEGGGMEVLSRGVGSRVLYQGPQLEQTACLVVPLEARGDAAVGVNGGMLGRHRGGFPCIR